MLENYGRSLEKARPDDLSACIESYREERQKAFEVHFDSETRISALEEERTKIQRRQSRALRKAAKEREKETKEAARKIEKKNRMKREKKEKQQQLKNERIQFWPRKVYRVTLSLDTNSDMTPMSSRRGSIDSLAKNHSEDTSGSCQISLSLSYITHSAYWSPRYDLSLTTTTRSGLITYRAELCNSTSETWKDARVVLSTSQTSFQGLGEPIPLMIPWQIRLSKPFRKDADSVNGALLSSHEVQYRLKGQQTKASEPRYVNFGLGATNNTDSSGLFSSMVPSQKHPMQQQQQHLAAINQAQGQHTNVFGSRNAPMAQVSMRSGGLFGNISGNSPHASGGPSGGFGAPAPQQETLHSEDGETSYDPTIEDTIIPELPSLATQESEWSESGLTATYEIPGLRTIMPSFTARRHKIASLALKDVLLSYVLVPKLRTAAFLKARICNTSSITLLKGSVGITLDGSFLGNSTIPRCSASDSFSLSLGVDPSVNVTYSKPIVKRSQTGVFQKEGSGVYTRTCTISNTKHNRSVEGLVLDQVPVSEDERLKIEIHQPPGLRNEGDTARSGIAANTTAAKAVEKWGRATAALKKGGEICWDFKLESSKAVKLILEYEARFPSTDVVVGI